MDNKQLAKRRWLPVGVVGLLSATAGAGLGAYLGNEAPISGGHVSAAIMAVIGGAWLGAILFGTLGVWVSRKVLL